MHTHSGKLNNNNIVHFITGQQAQCPSQKRTPQNKANWQLRYESEVLVLLFQSLRCLK